MNQISQINKQQLPNKLIDLPQIQLIPSSGNQTHDQIIIKQPQTDIVMKDVHYKCKDKNYTIKVQQKIIDGTRYFSCHACQKLKMFKKPSDFIRHYRSIHKKEKFACSICHKSYSLESTLKNHLTVHTMELICSICQKKFTSKKKLEAHFE